MIKVNGYISLKTITFADQEELMQLMQRIYPESYDHLWEHQDCSWYLNSMYLPKPLQLELEEKGASYYFIYYKKELTGILRFYHQEKEEFSPESVTTYLQRIYLGSETQGKGIAKVILDWLEIQAKENNASSIWLKAMDTQQQALKFYKKHGFEIIGETRLDLTLLKSDLRGMVILQKTL